MRVGVTGASGFIGRTLVDALHERGDDVVTFARPDSEAASGATIRWDPTRGVVDESDLRRHGGLDAVVNLAGVGIADRRWTRQRRAAVRASRVAATQLLVSALDSRGPDLPFLASGSAIGYYGDRGDDVVDESATRGPGFLADVCVEWERAATGGRPPDTVALLRSGLVLGAHGGSLRPQLLLFRLGLGGTLGDGHQWASPISLIDEVLAILWVIDHRLPGPVNLTLPEPVTNREFTKALGHALHRPAMLQVPLAVLGAVLGRELVSELIAASQRVVPRALEDSGYRFQHRDVASALSAVLNSRR